MRNMPHYSGAGRTGVLYAEKELEMTDRGVFSFSIRDLNDKDIKIEGGGIESDNYGVLDIPCIFSGLPSHLRVKFPHWGANIVTDWCMRISYFGGAGRGWWSLPQVGDQVICGFLNNQADCPIILGSVCTPRNPPPLKQQPNNNWRYIKTRSGSMILLDDAEGAERIVIQSKEAAALGSMVKTCNDPQPQATCTIIPIGTAVCLPILLPGMDPEEFERAGGTVIHTSIASQKEYEESLLKKLLSSPQWGSSANVSCRR